MTAARRAATAAATLAALAGAAVPAIAADGPTRLTLSVSTPDHTFNRAATLACDPAGGYHPNAVEACDALTAADGGFEHPAAQTRYCSMIYAPVTATASGTWHGRTVYWSRQYPNACVLEQRTGAVFRF